MTRRRARRFALTVCLALLASSGLLPGFTLSTASALPPGFQVTTALSGLNLPTALRFSPDGRVFVAEKHGLVKVFDDLSDTTPTVFADLSTEVHSYLDRGLLGLALHPSFPAVPYVYVAYTHDAVIGGTAPRWGTPGVLSDPCPDPPGGTTNGCVVSGRLSRLTADGNQMSAEYVLVEDWCQQFPSHSIGTVAFGPDGALYAGSGDGAITLDWGQRGDPPNPCGDPPGGVGAVLTPPTAEGGSLRSQDLRTSGDPVGLSGTIIRVDPITGEALPDNPMYSSADPNQRRIVASGLRNPYRFTFRPGTSEIWAGDVGERLVEEIDRIPVGDAIVENHGWPCYEGSPRQPAWDQRDFTICEQLYAQPGAAAAPFYSYLHGQPLYAGDTCSAAQSVVSSIAFYQGGSYPDAYDGALFFGDYGRDCIWVMLPNAPNGGLNPSSVQVFFENGSNPVDIQVGPGGDLFFVDVVAGRVRRIGYFGGDQPPVASIDASPVSGPAPLTVNFDGSDSSDAEGGALTFAWDLDGDGAFDDASTPTVSWTYETAADTTVGLRVTDPGGQVDIEHVVISVANDPPVPVIDLPTTGFTWHVGETIDFSGHASDPDEGALPGSALSWSVSLQHCDTLTDCHEHVVQEFDGQVSGSFDAPDHEYPAFLDLELTATDSRGLAVSTTIRLEPETTEVTMVSDPPGLQLGVGLTTQATPFTRTAIVGSTQSITAPSPQSLSSTPYEFVSWSNGGARTHDVVVNGPSTFSATFQAASTSMATVSDFQFQPKNIFPPIGGEVRWNFAGPSAHTVTDNTGMGLYDSGSRAPGGSYSFAFPAAGNYPFRCTIHAQMRGSVQIPVAISPTSGGVGTPFSITWASGAPPAGHTYDVQIRRAGSSVWQYFRQGTTTTSAVFTPDAGVGAYSFQARIRQVATGRATAYSTPVSINVTGNQPPVPVIDQPNSGFTWHVGESVDFSGHASDPEDGSVSAASLSWDVVVQDCSSGTCVATPYQSFDGQASSSFTAPDYEDPVFLDLVLTATDSGGLAVSTTVRLSPETTDVTMTSNPPGLQLGVGSTTQATPFTHTVIVGSTPSITAPSPQSLSSTPYEFVSWSDGGAGTHDVVVNGPSTYTATFQGVSVSMITVSDFLFQPKNVFPPIGGEVRWNFAGPSLHTVTDNTGMGLYDSGSRGPGSSYSFAFPAAGNYPFRCTIHPVQMRGSVQIPVAVSPTGGGVSTPFSITWASGAPPVGYVYDVQVRRAGSSTWQYYRQGTATTSAVFTPDAGVGIYSFQARIRLVSNGRAAAFSTPVSIDVA